MGSRPVQISIDAELLRRIDRDPEVRRNGRSAFIRSAVEFYLRARERRAVDAAIQRAYAGKSDAMKLEIESLIEGQEWPDE
jgi:metal-responsive CopG/Arc/MetJ family transcriptional regulator